MDLVQYIQEQLITEAYVNLLTKDEMREYEDELWSMVLKAYSYLITKECPTGIANTNSFDDMLDETDFIKCVRRNGKIVAAQFYKFKGHGRKAFAGCCDGTPQGKKDFAKIFEEDFTVLDRNSYIEVSDKAEHWLIDKMGYKKYVVPDVRACEILAADGKIATPTGDGIHYERELGGQMHTKLMVGNPKNI
jgi:hypothetical protein